MVATLLDISPGAAPRWVMGALWTVVFLFLHSCNQCHRCYQCLCVGLVCSGSVVISTDHLLWLPTLLQSHFDCGLWGSPCSTRQCNRTLLMPVLVAYVMLSLNFVLVSSAVVMLSTVDSQPALVSQSAAICYHMTQCHAILDASLCGIHLLLLLIPVADPMNTCLPWFGGPQGHLSHTALLGGFS
jgi:hypothetical protein